MSDMAAELNIALGAINQEAGLTSCKLVVISSTSSFPQEKWPNFEVTLCSWLGYKPSINK